MLRPTFLLIALVAFAATALAPGSVAAEQTPTRQPGTAQGNAPSTASMRVCDGGLEDGKAVVRRGQIGNDATETTLNACRIDGGSAVPAPQSPTLAAKRTKIT